jgi:hypothetical protein
MLCNTSNNNNNNNNNNNGNNNVIMAAQEQAISTNYFKKKIWNKKLKVDADCAKNMKRQLTTYQNVPLWQRMNP